MRGRSEAVGLQSTTYVRGEQEVESDLSIGDSRPLIYGQTGGCSSPESLSLTSPRFEQRKDESFESSDRIMNHDLKGE